MEFQKRDHDCVIVWFRQDLRLSDNPALVHAAGHGRTVLPLFLLDEDDPWTPGAASRWWLHESLTALDDALHHRGSGLVLRRGSANRILPELVRAVGATAIVWNRVFEPWAAARDRIIESDMEDHGVAVKTFNASLLAEPGSLVNKAGDPFRVFSPFWKALSNKVETTRFDQVDPLPAPPTLPPTPRSPDGDALTTWSLQPSRPDWAGGLRSVWLPHHDHGNDDETGAPGEAGAALRLDRFLDDTARRYKTDRDHPGLDATSRLSAHLHWGEISPRQVWARTEAAMTADPAIESGGRAFLRELGWREFSCHLLHHFPHITSANFNPQFDRFAWRDDDDALTRWQRGETGYPIVDAGMRELWETGVIHNRVRMVTASFLVKHLLVPWQAGAAWFWDTLVDADLANNSASWQWVAGSGADATPYFRIFNPVLQGEKFDADGAYVRRFVPELWRMPDKYIHRPWAAPANVLDYAGVQLDRTYPRPMVDHKAARDRALIAFKQIRK
ncbi:MAG: deoxyribodipyrimidine photo-lyase [Sphingomonadales bacterium]